MPRKRRFACHNFASQEAWGVLVRLDPDAPSAATPSVQGARRPQPVYTVVERMCRHLSTKSCYFLPISEVERTAQMVCAAKPKPFRRLL